MEDYADAIMQFLKEFTAEKISPTSDDDVQIRCGIVGNYSLKPEEINGEVTDWVLNYLEQRKCPYFLAVSLAKKVAQQISTLVCKRLMQSNGENIEDEDSMLQNATSLHTETIGRLRELCCELRDHPDQTGVSGGQPLRFEASVFAIKNGRRKMEDRHVILHDLNIVCDLQDAPNHSYYAVFDGHAGVETASFASAHLHTNIVQHPSFLKDTKTAIIEGFKLTDTQFSERASRENLKSGATAVCALIRESTLYVAWVGDSQALLIKQGRPHTIMNPHKPEREDERKRIEELGGYIYHHGTWRVNGTLAVSRALGDGDHKPFVSNEPEINVITLDGTEDFLVIACDGLWDKMSPDDVSVSLYRHLVDNPQSADSIAAKLVHQSKLMGSNDNITTIVVFLRDVPSLIAESPKYAAMFPQLEGINVSPVSQLANGTAGKSYSEQEVSCEIYEKLLENKYQRPTYFQKDLEFSSLDSSDWSPDSRMQEIHGRNGKYGVAEGMPPEQTSLSELPTPPIDEVVASKQFSEYSSSEQLKIFQDHLEAQGFHDVSLGEIQTSMSENLQFLSSEMQDDMGYLADDLPSGDTGAKEVPKLPFEDLTDAAEHEHFKSNPADTLVLTGISSTDIITNQVVKQVTHEVLNTASDLVLNTIETAVKHVSLGDSSSELSSGGREGFISYNPFEKQELDTVDSSLSIEKKADPLSPKSSHQLNPNAEPFVMKDFSFNPDTTISDSSMQFTKAGDDLSLLDLSLSSVPLMSDDVLVDESVGPAFVQDVCGDATISSQEVHSPLPSAPPLEEAFSEEQRASVSGECIDAGVVSSTQNNPFFSSVAENGGVDNRVSSTLIEVSPVLQEVKRQPSSVKEHESQTSFGQELESQSCLPNQQPEVQLPSVYGLEDQTMFEVSKPAEQLLLPSLEPIEQLPSSVEQPLPVPEQPLPVPEPLVEQPLPVPEPLVEQPLPVLEPIVEQPLSVLEHVIDKLPLEQLEQKLDVQHDSNTLSVEQSVDKHLQSGSLHLLDEGTLDETGMDSISKVKYELGNIQDSLSELSFTNSEDNSKNKISVLATESLETGYSSTSNQTLSEKSSLIVEHSVDQSRHSIQSEHPLQQGSFDDIKTGDSITNTVSYVEDTSTQVTKQVIGKDSLLPKEVQDKLLEVTSTTLQSQSVTEDAPVSAVAVDLQTVPDGVPEAEGVTEDMDSDSEKDGGWSYVKANNSSQEQKINKKAIDGNKVASKKPSSASKDRKVLVKPVAGDTRSKPRISGVTDAAKKTAPEKADKKVVENKDKDRPGTVLKTTTSLPVPPKTLTNDRKLIKKPTTTVPRSIPSKPSGTSAPAAAKQPASNVTSKTVASKPPIGGPEKIIGKPSYSSTPFRPTLPKPAPSAGAAKPLARPASATASRSSVTSSASVSKPNSLSQKPQPRASSAPLASKTLPSTKVSTTELKSNISPGAEVKPKPTGTTLRKPLPPAAKKQDVKETKDSTNKQILAKKTTSVSSSMTATQVRRTGVSTNAVKVDAASKKSGPSTTDTKTLKMSIGRTDVSKSSAVSKTATSRGRLSAQSKQSSKPVKSESDKKASEPKPSKNGPKKIVENTSSSDQKCNADNRIEEVNVEKGMLEANAKETADDKLAGASVDPLISVPAAEIVSKAELKQETNVVECPVSVTPAEEEKV